MDRSFSPEYKQLIARAREVALNLGYDYISTLHFFIADSEPALPGSIYGFAFRNEEDLLQFRDRHRLEGVDFLTNIHANLPLTKEAEMTIRQSETERRNYGQQYAYPCHFFIAALKAGNTEVARYFAHDAHALEKLVSYYEKAGSFRNDITAAATVPPGRRGIVAVIRSLFGNKR